MIGMCFASMIGRWGEGREGVCGSIVCAVIMCLGLDKCVMYAAAIHELCMTLKKR